MKNNPIPPLFLAMFLLLGITCAHAQVPVCKQCQFSNGFTLTTQGGCGCEVSCGINSQGKNTCACAICGGCVGNRCTSRAVTKLGAASWWDSASTQGLSSAVMKVSPTFGNFVTLLGIILSKHSEDDVATMRGKVDVGLSAGSGFVEWNTKIEKLPDSSGTKWVYLLGSRVMRVKPGVVEPSNDADIETIPDVHPEADRMEISVRNGQYSWAVYNGDNLLGTGVVVSSASVAVP